jgi:hypothetical protein
MKEFYFDGAPIPVIFVSDVLHNAEAPPEEGTVWLGRTLRKVRQDPNTIRLSSVLRDWLEKYAPAFQVVRFSWRGGRGFRQQYRYALRLKSTEAHVLFRLTFG